MHKPQEDPHNYDPQQSYAAKQLSRYDMQVAGIVVYIVAMAVLFVVALVFMLFGGTATEARVQDKTPATAAVQAGPANGVARAENAQARIQPRR